MTSTLFIYKMQFQTIKEMQTIIFINSIQLLFKAGSGICHSSLTETNVTLNYNQFGRNSHFNRDFFLTRT